METFFLPEPALSLGGPDKMYPFRRLRVNYQRPGGKTDLNTNKQQPKFT